MPHVATFALLLLAALAGCAQYACTYDARYAVEVEVVDASGNPRFVDDVTYTVDGVERSCELTLFNTFHCAPEVHGDILVRVLDAEEVLAEQAVDVGPTPDGCHVDTQQLQIVL